jgi:hypothetical protein
MKITIIPLVVLYSSQCCTFVYREELRLRMLENSVLRKIFGSNRKEVRGEWRRLNRDKLYDF